MIDSGEAVRKLALTAARLSGLPLITRPFLGGAGACLMLHRVTNEPVKPLGVNRHLSVTPLFLDRTIAEMKRMGYRFVTMDELADRLKSGCSSERFAAVSLDDGYRDNLVEALPVFEKHEVPFIVHVAPGLTDGETVLWWEIVEDIVTFSDEVCLPTSKGSLAIECRTPAEKVYANCMVSEFLTGEVAEADQMATLVGLARTAGIDFQAVGPNLLMNWDELARIAAHPLAEIGAHTMHHYNLKRLDDDAAFREIAGVRRVLERKLGRKPRHMAFPYGYSKAVGAREVAMAREAGFDTSVTTRHGVLQAGHREHLHALPRISVNGRYQRVSHIRTMLSGLTTPMANYGRRLVTV
ncbi:MAG: polysaccharide deacetylase family protein [Rhizobiaceae bacterium]